MRFLRSIQVYKNVISTTSKHLHDGICALPFSGARPTRGQECRRSFTSGISDSKSKLILPVCFVETPLCQRVVIDQCNREIIKLGAFLIEDLIDRRALRLRLEVGRQRIGNIVAHSTSLEHVVAQQFASSSTRSSRSKDVAPAVLPWHGLQRYVGF